MGALLIVQPMTFAGVGCSRGTGIDNLKTRSPKEAWADTAVGSEAVLLFDLGAVRSIDTVFLGFVRPLAAGASWTVTAGAGGYVEQTLQPATTARVPDVAGDAPELSHALWYGSPVSVRYVRIAITQPAGSPPLTAGIAVIGRAFSASFGPEWGGGRQTLDTGVATALPDGGFAVVEGVRKKLVSWTFGDLSTAEVDQLDLLAGDLGETAPALVIEDVAFTAGLRRRIHYGLFRRWQAFERRNARQTRWELTIEQWL